MATNPNSMVQEAVDTAINKRGEIGLQVVAYVDGKQVVDVWGGLADITTGRQVDADTVFPVFSVTKAVTAVAFAHPGGARAGGLRYAHHPLLA